MSKANQDIYKKFYSKSTIGGTISISDLREKEFSNVPLSAEESQALLNFDRFRLAELNKITDDMQFHVRYRELQVMSNLGDYRDFLDVPFAS